MSHLVDECINNSFESLRIVYNNITNTINERNLPIMSVLIVHQA